MLLAERNRLMLGTALIVERTLIGDNIDTYGIRNFKAKTKNGIRNK
jgi:hypothetical protein